METTQTFRISNYIANQQSRCYIQLQAATMVPFGIDSFSSSWSSCWKVDKTAVLAQEDAVYMDPSSHGLLPLGPPYSPSPPHSSALGRLVERVFWCMKRGGAYGCACALLWIRELPVRSPQGVFEAILVLMVVLILVLRSCAFACDSRRGFDGRGWRQRDLAWVVLTSRLGEHRERRGRSWAVACSRPKDVPWCCGGGF